LPDIFYSICFMAVQFEIRYASNPADVKHYDTELLRKQFLIQDLFVEGQIRMVYSHYDRFVVGGIVPGKKELTLETIDPFKAGYFLERREMGIINVGGTGTVTSDGQKFELKHKEALYLGKDNKIVIFGSTDVTEPANFYFNSAPAHQAYPNKKVTLAEAEVVELGSLETSNARKINKLLINSVVKTCQLQMGLTELQPGSVWNTMPPHVHSRRMEVYFYFNLPAGQAVCHYMGQPHETRHIWLKNKEAVISPDWSIHSASATSNYSFIWGMAGENLDYGDMDVVQPDQLK
jgi:4-deoxy-L-threo-5-hexosulose-uronate ketol-isomerase